MPTIPAAPLSTVHSSNLYERASSFMPGGVSSPVRAFKAVGGSPIFIERGDGAHLLDADANRYVDLIGSWGAAIVGHAHPAVVGAVQKTAADGLSFGACSRLEVELAERIVSAFAAPNIELIRFVSSGTEATMSAVRLARAATGRSRIVKFEGNYHGHADAFLVAAGSGAATLGTPNSPGVTPGAVADTLLAPYNGSGAVARLFEEHPRQIAAIVLEPLAGNMGFVRADDSFLKDLRALCDEHGALLIFDEVMTGFRVTWGGYQRLTTVQPDLTCLGKAIGGGLPAAAYAGPRRLMDRLSPVGPVYQAGTLSGNPLAMAAGIATLDLCAQEGFYQRLDAMSDRLALGFVRAAGSAGVPASADSLGGMLGWSFRPTPPRNFEDAKRADHAAFARFFTSMLGEGVFLPPSSYEAMFVSATHTDEQIAHILAAAARSLEALNR